MLIVKGGRPGFSETENRSLVQVVGMFKNFADPLRGNVIELDWAISFFKLVQRFYDF